MAEKKHVLMLLSNPFRPDPRVHKEAACLVSAGYRVTILCWDRDRKYPERESLDGIDIVRLGPLSGWSDALEMVRTLPRFWKNLRAAASGMDYEIIHAHDLDTLSPGLKLAASRKVPIVYDSHEIYHEMAGENLSSIPLKLLAAYERSMLRKPSVVITVNEPIADIFKSYGARDVRVIMNCQPHVTIDSARAEKLRQSLSPEGKILALYIGVLEPNRLLLELASAHSKGNGDFILVLGGFGSLENKLRRLAANSGGRVMFLGKVDPKDVPVYNQASGVLLATYDPALKNNRLGAPNKLFESMAAARPIIVSKGTYAARVVERSGCGLSASYDGRIVLSAVTKLMCDGELYARCAESGRRAYVEKFNWSVMEKRLLDMYSELLRQSD